MNMRKIVGTASCSLMALTLLMQPALAQAPNLGADWVFVKERKVKTFVPNPAKPGSGSWQLLDVTNRTYFLEDGQVSRKVATSRTESGEISAGQGPRVYGAEEINTRKAFETLQGDVPNSKNGYFEGNFLVSFKLTRYALFEDVTGFKSWTIYNRYATRTRDINYYLVEWTDPLTRETLSEVDSNPEYTAWVVGAPYDKDAASSGKDTFSRRNSLGTDDRRVILSKTYSPQASMADDSTKAPSTKVGTFVSNRGMGNTQVALSGSKLRTAMGANDAVASQAKQAESGGGSIKLDRLVGQDKDDKNDKDNRDQDKDRNKDQNTDQNKDANKATSESVSLIDRIVGTWQLKGGSKSEIKFERAGKSDNVKVDVALEIVRGADFDLAFTTQFAKTLSASKSGRTVSMQFNDAGTELTIKLGTIKATFVKHK